MSNKLDELIDISIRIGNTFNHKLVSPGRTYNFRMYRGDTIDSLKKIFIDSFDESIQNEIKKYNIYNNKIIPLHDDNIVNDAFTDSDSCNLDIIDRKEYLFYALTI